MTYFIHIIYPGEQKFYLSINGNFDNNYDVLEYVFDHWNNNSNHNYRTLNVNDIVYVNNTYYQCTSTGWSKITESDVLSLDSEILSRFKSLPNPSQTHPSIILNSIMQSKYAKIPKNIPLTFL